MPAHRKNAPGPAPFTQLGGALQSAAHSAETISPDSHRDYYGHIWDIRLPLGESRIETDGLSGILAKLSFDSRIIDKQWHNTWFRLKHDVAQLLLTHGTVENIRLSRLRALLRISGTAMRRGELYIVGDKVQEYQYRGYENTPVRVWGDLVSGLSAGKLPYT